MRKKAFGRARRLAATACCLLLFCGLWPSSLAEDIFTLDVDRLDMGMLNSNDYVARYLSAPAQGIQVKKHVSDSSELAESVRLTLVQMDTRTLLFDKDYGYQSNDFYSDAIYLPYVGNRAIPYLVTLYVGDTVYAMPFMQLQSRLQYNGACTYGLRLSDLGLSGDWLMGTMLDLNELRFTGAAALDVCASNAYVLGQAIVMMENERIAVELNLYPSANAEVHGLSVYVLADCAGIGGDPAYMGFPAYSLGEWIDVSGAGSALLYMPMQVSYDPVGLGAFVYDPGSGYLQSQRQLWDDNRAQAIPVEGEAVMGDPSLLWPQEAGNEQTGELWPGGEGQIDGGGTDQPGGEGQPGGGTEQPGGEGQPGGGTDRPGGEGQPGDGAEQPGGEGQPGGGTDQPCNSNPTDIPAPDTAQGDGPLQQETAGSGQAEPAPDQNQPIPEGQTVGAEQSGGLD